MKNFNKSYLVVALLLVLAALYYFVYEDDEDVNNFKMESTFVKTMLVGEKSINEQALVFAGEVRSQYETDLSFQVDGKITSRLVSLGEVVNAGDKLFAIDSRDLIQNNIKAKAQLNSARAKLTLAEKNLARHKTLLTKEATSQMQLDAYEQEYQDALANVEQSKAELQQSVNELEYSELSATRSGVLVQIIGEVGQVVSAGTTVAKIADLENLEIHFYVPESKINLIKKGMNLTVNTNTNDSKDIAAKVIEIAPFADLESRTFLIKARLEEQAESKNIHLGMTVNVRISQNINETIIIPRTAIVNNNAVGVWVVENEKAHFNAVELGNPIGDNVEVISGLNKGARIITAGVHRVLEGEKVNSDYEAL